MNQDDVFDQKSVNPGVTEFDVRDRLAIINVLHSYGFFIDSLRYDDYFGLFTDHPQIEFRLKGQSILAGFDEWKAYTIERQERFRREGIQRRHVLTAPRFDRQESDIATGQIYVQLYKVEGGILSLILTGFYEFTAVKIHNGWKIDRWIGNTDLPND